MISATLSHYRMREKPGAGGMGEVFCVHDATLYSRAAICSLLHVAAVRAGANYTAATAAAITLYGKTSQALRGLLG